MTEIMNYNFPSVFNLKFLIETEDLKDKNIKALYRTNESVLKHWIKKVENLPQPQKIMKFPSTSKRLFHSEDGSKARRTACFSAHFFL